MESENLLVDKVWCSDITYIPMAKRHAYLVAIMDWYSRAVPVVRAEQHDGQQFCVCALNVVTRRTGRLPKIFKIDQGAQSTS